MPRDLGHELGYGRALDPAAGHPGLLGAESRIGGCIVPPLVDEPSQGFPILGTYVLGILSGWGLVGLIKRLF